MKKSWIGALALGLVIAGADIAAAQCPDAGGTQFIVDTLAEANQVGAGYNDPTCDLIINTTVTASIQGLGITAKSIVIQGPDTLDNTVRAGVVNPLAGGKVFLTASGGNITLNEARVLAAETTVLQCSPLDCDIQISLSDVIAASNLMFGGNGGTLQIKAQDVLNIQSSTVYGGNSVLVTSIRGSVTWICVPGAGGCKDPLVSGVVSQLLDVTTGQTCAQRFAAAQPCRVDFLDSAALKAVCIQAPGVNCGGGRIELHITAFVDVHIENSKIDSPGTFVIRARTGRIFATGAQLTAAKFEITAQGDGVNTAADFSNAVLTTPGGIRLTAQTCPAPATVCIDLSGADVMAQDSNKLPFFNGDNSPPLDPNVLDTAAECNPAAQAVLNDANAIVRAANGNGTISICGAQFN